MLRVFSPTGFNVIFPSIKFSESRILRIMGFYGASKEASKKWTMPIRDWGTILNSFLLIFGNRIKLIQ
jgi:transposase-like protein